MLELLCVVTKAFASHVSCSLRLVFAFSGGYCLVLTYSRRAVFVTARGAIKITAKGVTNDQSGNIILKIQHSPRFGNFVFLACASSWIFFTWDHWGLGGGGTEKFVLLALS